VRCQLSGRAPPDLPWTRRHPAGPGSTTHSQLLELLSAGFSTDEDRLNELAASLSRNLTQQDGAADMVVANSIWTRDVEVKRAYADAMQAALQVGHDFSGFSGVAGALVACARNLSRPPCTRLEADPPPPPPHGRPRPAKLSQRRTSTPGLQR
jgi:hypothetical protein